MKLFLTLIFMAGLHGLSFPAVPPSSAIQAAPGAGDKEEAVNLGDIFKDEPASVSAPLPADPVDGPGNLESLLPAILVLVLTLSLPLTRSKKKK